MSLVAEEWRVRLDLLDYLDHLDRARLDLRERAGLPRVRRVLWPERVGARDPADRTTAAALLLEHLPRHVGRVHESERAPARGRDLALDGVQVRVRRCVSAQRDVHAAALRRPAPVGEVLLEGSARLRVRPAE